MPVAIALFASMLAVWYGHTYWLIVADEGSAKALSVTPESEPKLGRIIVGDRERYFARYSFRDGDGRLYTARQAISHSRFEALSQGDAWLTVYYSRARPEVSAIDLQAVQQLAVILAAIAALAWIWVIVRLARATR
ncbi:DUF3592 domain-containing protein [Hyphomicrobium sulfonivorans]|uniref:DUF3592 domain-containing protein n=1 Tax=Hyphomicrobium sulfonivorans TaxID=121290 RepID=UPI00156EB632|nr:DUF3592 domain-containing protein [Hyphomicrobium sulfonivorans]MBI1649998.1 hypothetical protein [Hyphomicrobium sulfonivorans]NSL72916.1 hypothetical protein [Hyphomicrobium sulfonivorans]